MIVNRKKSLGLKFDAEIRRLREISSKVWTRLQAGRGALSIYPHSIIGQFAKPSEMPCYRFGTSWITTKFAYSALPRIT